MHKSLTNLYSLINKDEIQTRGSAMRNLLLKDGSRMHYTKMLPLFSWKVSMGVGSHKIRMSNLQAMLMIIWNSLILFEFDNDPIVGFIKYKIINIQMLRVSSITFCLTSLIDSSYSFFFARNSSYFFQNSFYLFSSYFIFSLYSISS